MEVFSLLEGGHRDQRVLDVVRYLAVCSHVAVLFDAYSCTLFVFMSWLLFLGLQRKLKNTRCSGQEALGTPSLSDSALLSS